MKQELEINIERLTLQGFNSIDRFRIGESLKIELTRLITKQGVPLTLGQPENIFQMEGASIKNINKSNPEIAGNQIANSIYLGLKNE